MLVAAMRVAGCHAVTTATPASTLPKNDRGHRGLVTYPLRAHVRTPPPCPTYATGTFSPASCSAVAYQRDYRGVFKPGELPWFKPKRGSPSAVPRSQSHRAATPGAQQHPRCSTLPCPRSGIAALGYIDRVCQGLHSCTSTWPQIALMVGNRKPPAVLFQLLNSATCTYT